jgi:hypothetical protein
MLFSRGRLADLPIDVLGKVEERSMPMRCLSGTADPHQVLLIIVPHFPLLICTILVQTLHAVSPNNFF